MKTNLLLARYGLKESDLIHNPLKKRNIAGELLVKTLDLLNINSLRQLEEMTEEEFLMAYKKASYDVQRMGGEALINPLHEELPLNDIDLPMRGIVRWMNELGIYTAYCCDGHGKRTPCVYLLTYPTQKQVQLLRVSAPMDLKLIFQGKKVIFQIKEDVETHLLDFAERLFSIVVDPSTLTRYEADAFRLSLISLLHIQGESGQEEMIDVY